MDIISILKKMRLNPSSFHIEVKSERAEDHPKRFTDIHIHYAFEGDCLKIRSLEPFNCRKIDIVRSRIH